MQPLLPIQQVLVAIGKRGKWVLPLGLLVALALPNFANAMQVAIGPLLAILLVISFLQLNDQQSWFADLRRSVLLLLCMQLVLPIAILLFMRALSVPVQWQVPITLVGAASCITGGPSIVMMLGGNGAAAIRLLILSTLALPITAFPVLAMLPLHSSHEMLIRTALMLSLVVLGTYATAKLLRRYILAPYSQAQRGWLDGAAAFLLAFIVLGLMAAIHTAWDAPALLATTLFWAFVVNFAYQFIGLGLNHLFCMKLPIVFGVMTGNRAVAIFLTALPASAYQPFLLFIACYQIPMYLTPLLGSYIYRRYTSNAI